MCFSITICTFVAFTEWCPCVLVYKEGVMQTKNNIKI